MPPKSCENCLFNDDCRCTGQCKFFTPLEYEEDYIDEIIEEGRRLFHSEWYEYISEDKDLY